MREGSMDIVLNKVMKRRESLIKTLTTQMKGTQPFAEIKLSPELQLWAINNLHPNDMQNFINEFGQDRVGYMLYQMNELKMKQGLRQL